MVFHAVLRQILKSLSIGLGEFWSIASVLFLRENFLFVLFLRFLQLWFSNQMESLSKADLAEEAIESTGKEEEGKVLESSFKMAKMMMMMMMI